MDGINMLTHWDFRQPVRQRTDYCTACGNYKSAVEKWNGCICEAAMAKLEPRHLEALVNIPLSSVYDFGTGKALALKPPQI